MKCKMSKFISYKMYLVSYLRVFASGRARPSCLQSLLTPPSGKHLTVKYKLQHSVSLGPGVPEMSNNMETGNKYSSFTDLLSPSCLLESQDRVGQTYGKACPLLNSHFRSFTVRDFDWD